jgi:hypothetical protein
VDVRRIAWLLVIVLTLPACADDATGGGSLLAQTSRPCPAVDALTPRRTTEPLPGGFQPVSAVRCTFQVTLGAPDGFDWVAAQRSTGPFDALVHALRLPPEKPSGDSVCPAVMLPPHLLALTDAAGTTLVPALPGGVCGSAIPEVDSALDALTWADLDRHS